MKRIRFTVTFDPKLHQLITVAGKPYGSVSQAIEAAALAFVQANESQRGRMVSRRARFIRDSQ